MENIGNFRSFRKLNNKQIHIPRKLTGVPGCVRTVERILTLYPSYRQKTLLPVKDPRHIYNFLQYCNNLRTRGSGHATSVVPAANPVPLNNPSMGQFQTRPTGNASGLSTGLHGLPDKEELDWWNGLWSGALGSSVNPSAL